MEKNLEKLEFNKILNILQGFAKTYIGKDLCNNLLPINNKEAVQKSLDETTEASSLIERNGNPPISEIDDITIWIKRLESGSSLSAKALLEIASILRLARELKNYYSTEEDSNYPLLSELFNELYENKDIETKIGSAILDEDTIADNASKKLATLRRNRKNIESQIKNSLNNFVHSTTYSKYMMESLVTIRADRYVVPVKAEYRSQIKGFIHDFSSSGSTVYIEPMQVFEMNNEIGNIKMEEEIEIERILTELSALLMEYTGFLNINLKTIGTLDFIFAKAKYSISIDGISPKLNDEKYINLIKARHPLIDKTQVVPIDIGIGNNYSTLVITGPNTGGKTVTLKTVGLLTEMAKAGLHIPANKESSVYVFDKVYADIGDEQSIQESLSTFSSHMTNIVEILNSVSSKSLVLLDELGSGTDPLEGAALAISILKHLNTLGVITLITSHYQEVKDFALVTAGFENASSEFDIENLKPTYKILVGIPGKSNAFAISRKLGLSEDILSSATTFLKEDSIHIEDVLKGIYDDKIEIEKEKEEIIKNKNQIEVLRKSLERENKSLDEEEKIKKEKAKQEALDIVLDAKDDANRVIKELEKMLKKYEKLAEKEDLKKANELRNSLNESVKNIQNNGQDKNKKHVILFSNSISQNDHIRNEKGNNKRSSSDLMMKSKTTATEINVIGETVDIAVPQVDMFLDSCYLAGMEKVRIVHGKGTGKLREGIHKYLKTNKNVKSFRVGGYGEGEMGVTIVELK